MAAGWAWWRAPMASASSWVARERPPSIAVRSVERRSTLTALAILHFEEALDAPSARVDEATHREMADLLRWLGETAPSAEERELVALALDSVEDGLPGDAVSLRLMALLAAMARGTGTTTTPPDALEIVLGRAREIGRG